MARNPLSAIAGRAFAINARAGAHGLPALLFFTDPARVSDPLAIAARLPRGAGVVFRHFGAANRQEQGARLAALCRRRGLRLLVGADIDLARRLRADGVHLPERMARAARRLKRRRWLVSVAAHGRAAFIRGEGADAFVISPVFPSRSPSAGEPLGVRRARALAHGAGAPVYLLGGVNARTAIGAHRTGAVGLAAVDALRT